MVQICRTIVHCAPSSPSLVSSHCSRKSSNRPARYKATDEQIHAYKSLVIESCRTIEIPNEVLNCIDLCCLQLHVCAKKEGYIHVLLDKL